MQTLLKKPHSLHKNLVLAIGFCLLLLFMRIQWTHSFFYAFLVWNLFLAAIPFGITQMMKKIQGWQKSKGISFVLFIVWLLFLPNSPYIITDLIHLQKDGSQQIWFDIFLVFAFALTGLILGLLSMLDMCHFLLKKFTQKTTGILLFAICMLCGYGIYLGRFLRFNSWDILTKPLLLFEQIVDSLTKPKVWVLTLAFGGLLWILFSLLQSISITYQKSKYD